MEKSPDKKKQDVDIIINEKWCKKCRICVAFCPTGALVSDDFGMPVVKDSSKCIKCMLCVIRCPDLAIDVKDKDKKKEKGE